MEAQQKGSKAKWAKTLEVSCSGYYSWIKERAERKTRYQALVKVIDRVFNEEGEGHYGAERVCGVIREQGGKASYRKVKAIMDEHNWISSHCKRKTRSNQYKNSSKSSELQNLVRGLQVTKPFQVIASDISIISTAEGKEYICQVRDVYSNVVLGYAMQSRMTADIVQKAVASARGRWQIPEQVIFHSDRGSQYTAKEVMEELRTYGYRLSFSDVGKPSDNPWSESFFSILKKEIIHKKPCKSRKEVRSRIFEYVETYYNVKRAQKRLGYKAPLKYMKNWRLTTNMSLP